jgi:hypothetical protein
MYDKLLQSREALKGEYDRKLTAEIDAIKVSMSGSFPSYFLSLYLSFAVY